LAGRFLVEDRSCERRGAALGLAGSLQVGLVTSSSLAEAGGVPDRTR
jgi:hypothetical protein